MRVRRMESDRSRRDFAWLKRKLGVALLAGVIATLAVPGCADEKKEGQEQAERRVTIVEAAPVVAQDVQVTVRSVGSLEAVHRVSVAPEIRGFVKTIHFEENQRVEKGQLLVELDDRKLKLEARQAENALGTAIAALEQAKASIKRAEADVENRKSIYERDEKLYESGIASEAQFIQSKTAYESAVAALEEARATYARAQKEAEEARTLLALARERLADGRITAPLSGVLGERQISPGDYVEPGQALVELVVMDPIEIAFSVPEKYKGRIREGQEVVFETPAMDRPFSGATSFISPTVDPATRSIKLKAQLANPDGLLQPGFFGAVRLILETHPNAPVIPESAVVPREEKTFVYTVNNSEAHLKEVVLGEHFDGRVEVLEGLTVGETVITAGQQKVADGYPVKVRE
ncbi:MAG: efflux RND transporter periplasmic adaptor subunit [Candidatus Abyssubacteria bacterium]